MQYSTYQGPWTLSVTVLPKNVKIITEGWQYQEHATAVFSIRELMVCLQLYPRDACATWRRPVTHNTHQAKTMQESLREGAGKASSPPMQAAHDTVQSIVRAANAGWAVPRLARATT
jgi:hypothetical protein